MAYRTRSGVGGLQETRQKTRKQAAGGRGQPPAWREISGRRSVGRRQSGRQKRNPDGKQKKKPGKREKPRRSKKQRPGPERKL